jgi:small subunit ribosomal protein S20
MPVKRAALRQLRKDRRRQAHNQAIRSHLKTLTKRFTRLLNEQKLDEARGLLRVVTKRYDRAASIGVVHRNTAARSKSRLTRQLNRRQAPQQ